MQKASIMDECSSQENSIQNGGFMHRKNIKLIVRKQLKKGSSDSSVLLALKP